MFHVEHRSAELRRTGVASRRPGARSQIGADPPLLRLAWPDQAGQPPGAICSIPKRMIPLLPGADRGDDPPVRPVAPDAPAASGSPPRTIRVFRRAVPAPTRPGLAEPGTQRCPRLVPSRSSGLLRSQRRPSPTLISPLLPRVRSVHPEATLHHGLGRPHPASAWGHPIARLTAHRPAPFDETRAAPLADRRVPRGTSVRRCGRRRPRCPAGCSARGHGPPAVPGAICPARRQVARRRR
jgi:hypothetical protein